MAEHDAVLRRDSRVVWRCAPDRVITARVGDTSAQAANELHGAAAVVWLALDEPATTEQLAARLADADVETDWTAGLTMLLSNGLVVADDEQIESRP